MVRRHAPGTLAAFVLAGFALILAGRLGRWLAFPAWGRWVLAPFHGLSMWFLWIWGLLEPRLQARSAVTDGAGTDRDGASGRQAARFTNLAPAESAHSRVLDLASWTVEELMIPRSQVAALEGNRTIAEAIAQVARAPHTVYPVYGESVDQPLGVVRILDLAPGDDRNRAIRDLARGAPLVPETMKGLNLLRDLADASTPAALVLDEFGGMAGLVTMEDLIEVVVGDLVGEHEIVRARIVQLEPGLYRVDGTCTIEEFNLRFGPLLPEGEYETVAGLFLDRVGRIPQAGEVLSLPRVSLEVTERDERRILQLTATVRDLPSESPASARPAPGARVPRG
jgi:CBS domain containing-hemolysin-like protein